MIKILDSSLNRQAILKEVINPNRFEEINGENKITFSAVFDEKASTYIDENSIVEIDGDYFDLVYYSKNQNEDGTLTINVEAEHISYRLIDYTLEYFTKTGTPTAILTELLSGTDFTVGTVEFSDSMTYSALEEMTKRQILIEFVNNLGGEIDFDKFEVSILKHRGSSDPRILTVGKNIKILSKVYNKRETDESGNPLVAYTCEPIQSLDNPFTLGDEVLLIQKDLGIQETLRIVRLGYDPYNPMTAEIELANFISGVEDQMYRIKTQTVVKDKLYYGARIGPTYGFENIRSDNKARAYFNADEMKMQAGDGSGTNWIDKLFFDPVSGEFVFNGKIYADEGEFSGTVSGAEIIGGTITIGSGDSVFKADTEGIWLGDADFENAPFKVNMAGELVSFNGQFIGGEVYGGTYYNTSETGWIDISQYESTIFGIFNFVSRATPGSPLVKFQDIGTAVEISFMNDIAIRYSEALGILYALGTWNFEAVDSFQIEKMNFKPYSGTITATVPDAPNGTVIYGTSNQGTGLHIRKNNSSGNSRWFATITYEVT